MLVWRRHGVPLLLAGRFTETGTLGFVSRPLWQDEHRAVGFFVNFSFLDSDICLQDNLILGNFSDLYIFHLEIIFFCAESGEKQQQLLIFAPCVMKGGIFASCLVNCKAYGWRLLNEKSQHFTVLQSWFIVANKEWEKYERCLPFFQNNLQCYQVNPEFERLS